MEHDQLIGRTPLAGVSDPPTKKALSPMTPPPKPCRPCGIGAGVVQRLINRCDTGGYTRFNFGFQQPDGPEMSIFRVKLSGVGNSRSSDELQS